jgi:dnd system-associated protein 4
MVIKGRIRVAREKAEFIRSLKTSENAYSPFQTYTDVVCFAAALGASRNRRMPLGETSRKEPDPIPQEQFFTRGYESLFNLLAVTSTGDPKILSSSDEYEAMRIQIFEEFANAGFEILQTELTGVVDYSEQILLLLSRQKTGSQVEEFDLSRFL